MDMRCTKCNKLLARYKQCLELEIKCTRCGTHNQVLQSEIAVGASILSNCQYANSLPGLNPMPSRHSQR